MSEQEKSFSQQIADLFDQIQTGPVYMADRVANKATEKNRLKSAYEMQVGDHTLLFNSTGVFGHTFAIDGEEIKATELIKKLWKLTKKNQCETFLEDPRWFMLTFWQKDKLLFDQIEERHNQQVREEITLRLDNIKVKLIRKENQGNLVFSIDNDGEEFGFLWMPKHSARLFGKIDDWEQLEYERWINVLIQKGVPERILEPACDKIVQEAKLDEILGAHVLEKYKQSKEGRMKTLFIPDLFSER